MWFGLSDMDWHAVQVPAAIIAGVISLAVGLVTAFTTLRVAKHRVAADIALAERRMTADIALAERRAAADIALAESRMAVDQKLLELRGQIDRDIGERRATVDERLSEMKANFDRELAEQKARLDNRALFAAEQVAHTLLMHPEWESRTFRIIKARLGGFDDEALRQILVRAGAIRFIGRDGQTGEPTERWGLLDRNRKLLTPVDDEPETAEP